MIKKRFYLRIRDFFNILCGIGITISLSALYTEFKGIDEYIKLLTKGKWLTPKVSIPIYGGLLVVAIIIIYSNNKQRRFK